METEWLRTFIKTENFREVAEKCFVMQSTVTKHIQHLEKALQTQLFDRHGKQVKLNSVGAHFFNARGKHQLQGDNKKSKRIVLHTIFFLLGFSIIFIFLGYSSSVVGWFFFQYQNLLRQVGTILIVIFGLMIIVVISPKFLMNDRKNTV